MKVLQILQRKGSDEIASVAPDTRVSEVVAELGRRKIGCLLVLEGDGSIAGIVSERDIVRVIGERSASCLDEDVAAIMTSPVITCEKSDDDTIVLAKMTEGRFRHLPVVDDGSVVGLISIGDVVKARIDSLRSENEELENMIRAATA